MVLINDGSLLNIEIQGMMYGFGDCREPRKDTADIIEKILKSQLIKFLELLTEAAARIGSKKIGVNEFLVLLRYKHYLIIFKIVLLNTFFF